MILCILTLWRHDVIITFCHYLMKAYGRNVVWPPLCHGPILGPFLYITLSATGRFRADFMCIKAYVKQVPNPRGCIMPMVTEDIWMLFTSNDVISGHFIWRSNTCDVNTFGAINKISNAPLTLIVADYLKRKYYLTA